jgi:hypothetical protein
MAKLKKKKKEVAYPWPKKMDDVSCSNPLVLNYMCRHKPLASPPKLVPLPFELPLIQIQSKIQEVNLASPAPPLPLFLSYHFLVWFYSKALGMIAGEVGEN